MISGQSPESRSERRQQQRNTEEIEGYLALAALQQSIEISHENTDQLTDTDSLSNDEP
jgi:hypothetical protein